MTNAAIGSAHRRSREGQPDATFDPFATESVRVTHRSVPSSSAARQCHLGCCTMVQVAVSFTRTNASKTSVCGQRKHEHCGLRDSTTCGTRQDEVFGQAYATIRVHLREGTILGTVGTASSTASRLPHPKIRYLIVRSGGGAIQPKPRRLTKPFSPSGKTPTPTSPS